MSIEAVANEFVKFYYQTFDTNRANLGVLYRPTSLLSFNGTVQQGAKIAEHLASLPFQKVAHQVSTIDCLPTPADGIVVEVTGALHIDDGDKPMAFCQTFLLFRDGGSFFVQNDIFRLVLF